MRYSGSETRNCNRRVVEFAAILLTVLLAALPLAAAESAAEFDPGLAGFTLTVGDVDLTHQVNTLSLLPDQQLSLRITEDGGWSRFEAEPSAGELTPLDDRSWIWQAPPLPGHYTLFLHESGCKAEMTLNLFVVVPFDQLQDGVLNGQRIGYYPWPPYNDLDVYLPPDGFIEVTPELMNVAVSPHFTLGQFICKQESGFPKYMVLRTRLLNKLESILGTLNERGVSCSSLAVLSGFRTPHYNERIRNVRYSRHLWGCAADVYVDVAPADGVMDDLNGDGRCNSKDAQFLFGLVDELEETTCCEEYVGGLGLYRNGRGHGPFVHVDVRGFRARWDG